MSVIIVSPKTVSRKGAKKKTQREFKIPLRLSGFLRDFA
jgi:hypothetical protein